MACAQSPGEQVSFAASITPPKAVDVRIDSRKATASSPPVKRHGRLLHSFVFVNAGAFDPEQPESARHAGAFAIVDEESV